MAYALERTSTKRTDDTDRVMDKAMENADKLKTRSGKEYTYFEIKSKDDKREMLTKEKSFEMRRL